MGHRLTRILVIALLVLSARSAVALDLGDRRIRLHAETYDRTTGPAPGRIRASSPAPDELVAWIVAYRGPSDEIVRETISNAGGRIVGYVPSNAYIVRATTRSVHELRQAEEIARVDRYHPDWKISPEITKRSVRASPEPRVGATELLHVEIFEDADAARVAERVRALGAEVLRAHDNAWIHRLEVEASWDLISEIARLPAVEWIEPFPQITPRNDDVRWVLQSNEEDRSPLTLRGLEGTGQIIGHIDGPIYHLSCFFLDPADPNPGPNHRKIVAYRRQAGFGRDPHGTHTAGTAAGNAEPVNGSTTNRGIAPRARLSHANVNEVTINPSNLNAFLVNAHADGARVHTNSYGDDSRTSYTTLARDIDLFSRNHEDDLVVWAVSNQQSLRTPENAKNCLAVGASRGPPDQHFHMSGGTGPTIDGRRKPEVYAPGQQTISASTAAPCATIGNTGTSMAAPAVAGAAALLREYFVEGYYPSGRQRPDDGFTPTGALLKAMLIGSSVDMTGVTGYPSDREGWGRILLDNTVYFAGDREKMWLADVRHAQGLSTGQESSWDIEIRSGDLPLDVTMVFADAPASVGASLASINDLNLEVEGPDGLFRGNVFDTVSGSSITGGSADPLNNVERVIVAFPAPGTWTVRVRAPDVPVGPQGFAVVATGNMPGIVRVPDRKPPPHPALRDGFSLLTPIPNPFDRETQIQYVVAERGRVQLRVFDLHGRMVRSLVDRVIDRGVISEPWDGTNTAGQRVAAGVYLIRMDAPGYTESVKSVLLH